MHLLIVDSQAGIGSGHNLAFTGMLVGGARSLGWDLTVLAPHPPAPGPLRWEPIPAAIVEGRSPRRARAVHRANIELAGRLARSMRVDLVIDPYLHTELGLPRFPPGTPTRVRLTHHRLKLRTARVRRWGRRWSPPHVSRLARLVADGDVLAAMTPVGLDGLAAQVPDARTVLLMHPVAMDVEVLAHAPSDPPVAAFLGEPRADKGWPELVAALPLVTNPMSLAVISVATPTDRPSRIGQVDVRWIDDVRDHVDFQRAMIAADLAVLPHTERFAQRGGTSGTVLEALAAGLPIVAGPAVGTFMPEDPRAYRRVDPADPVALAAAIDAMLDDLPGAREAARGIGPAEVAARHDPAVALAELAAHLGLA